MKKFFSAILCVAIIASLPTTVFAAKDTLISPSGLFMAQNGDLMVADAYNKVIWRQNSSGNTVVAGRTAPLGVNDTPQGIYLDGTPDKAGFLSPWGITNFLDGYAVTDSESNTVRFVNNTEVSTVAGNGTAGNEIGFCTDARFSRPTGIATDEKGNLYVSDTDNHVIKKIDTEGNVTLYAGSNEGNADGDLLSAAFREPTGLCYSNGKLYVADTGNHSIRLIENNTVVTLAGKAFKDNANAKFYEGGFIDGASKDAEFSSPQGVFVKNNIVYVADTMNAAIRKVENGTVTTIYQNNDTQKNLFPVMPRSLTMKGNELIVGDVFAKTIFKVSTQAGSDSTDKSAEEKIAEQEVLNDIRKAENAASTKVIVISIAMLVVVLGIVAGLAFFAIKNKHSLAEKMTLIKEKALIKFKGKK